MSVVSCRIKPPLTTDNRQPTTEVRLIVGIDAGGTKTVALLARADEGTILGQGIGGPGNIRAVGAERVTAALTMAIASAFAAETDRGREVAVAHDALEVARVREREFELAGPPRMALDRLKVVERVEIRGILRSPVDLGLAHLATERERTRRDPTTKSLRLRSGPDVAQRTLTDPAERLVVVHAARSDHAARIEMER